MTKYFKYLRYVLRHKWFVFIECCKVGIPLRGFLHDMSKFLPSEFIPYARHFYGKDPRKRDKTGNPKFALAWLMHQKRNNHHWQFWLLIEDGGDTIVFEMPLKYRKEMLCDWKGAGKAQGTPDTIAWYRANSHKLRLGPVTRIWIEEKLGCSDVGFSGVGQSGENNE